MKILILFLFCGSWVLDAAAQPPAVYDGPLRDSVVFDFTPTMPLAPTVAYRLDTTGSGLWRLGPTTKSPFGTATVPRNGLVTDAGASYGIRSNSSVTLCLTNVNSNPIVSFRHRFQTPAGQDGGTVECSNDSGQTWFNVLSGCPAGSSLQWHIARNSFYTANDTLRDGTPAFSGSIAGWRTSRIQFWSPSPLAKTTARPCNFANDSMLVRFRFQSDSIPDTLGGWMIDRIVVYPVVRHNGITDEQPSRLGIHPNPSRDGHIYLDWSSDTSKAQVRVVDVLGRTRLHLPYAVHLDVSALPNGLYILLVEGAQRQASARFLLE